MSTTAEKLTLLLNTKADIKAALVEKLVQLIKQNTAWQLVPNETTLNLFLLFLVPKQAKNASRLLAIF
jgi:hypothetical protein